MSVPVRRILPPEDKGDRAVRFISKLTLSKSTDKFLLRQWQEFIVRTLFGTLTDEGMRVFTKLLLMIPRKNGKTELIAAIVLFCMLADGEKNAEVYSVASTREQAALVYKAAKAMVKASPALDFLQGGVCDCLDSTKTIIVRKGPQAGSTYKALASEAGAQHGLNASVVVFDEVHVGDRDLWDVMATSQSARRQPLFLAISTAGVYDKEGLLYQQYEQAKQTNHYLNGTLVRGSISIPTLLAVIYEAPKDADWTDEAVWRACNPALGDFKRIEKMREMAEEAKRIPAKEYAFRQLELNQWTEAAVRWMSSDSWDACAAPVDLEALKGKPAFIGIDLSTTTDLTAAVLVFPNADDKPDVFPMFFVPEDKIAEREQKDDVSYRNWRDEKHLIATPGNVVDYAYIRKTLKEWQSTFSIQFVAYDPRFASALIPQLQDDGFECVKVGQSMAAQSGPTQSLEQRVLAKRIRHNGSPVLGWNIACCSVEQDAGGGIRLSKVKSTGRIDGAAALVNAIDAMERNPVNSGINYFDLPEASIWV